MQPPPQQHVAPQYSDSVHTGDVIGQQIMQQNIHHHATQFQQVLQPCMGCGSRSYIKPVPCSASHCKTICCNQCIKFHGSIIKTAVCGVHFRMFNKFKNVFLGLLIIFGGLAAIGLLVSL